MKVKVNPDICIGCSLCVSTCPEVFRMQEDKAVAFVEVVPAKLSELCRKAVDECPVTAIEIIEN